MSLIDVVKVQIDRSRGEAFGFIASPIFRVRDSVGSNFIWGFDIDLQGASTNPNSPILQTIKSVPIDDPSREVFTADIGTRVRLSRRSSDSKYLITGLSKFVPGTLSICLVTISDSAIIINDPVTFGTSVRLLTYDELGPLGGVYGNLRYNTVGKFDINNNLILLIQPQ